MSAPLLEVAGLQVTASTPAGARVLVQQADLAVGGGQLAGLVGASGSGKTLTAMAVAGLLPGGVGVTAGQITLGGLDVTDRSAEQRRRILRDDIGVVFQQAMSALNYRLNVGDQIDEALAPDGARSARARFATRRARRRRVLELLDRVGIADPARRQYDFPHELSGGIAQRVVIAMALARSPKLLIADEPTTALDASVQRQVMDLLDTLRRDLQLAVLLVTHDVAMVAARADEIVVMADGRTVAAGTAADLLEAGEPLAVQLEAIRRPIPAAPPAPDRDRVLIDVVGVSKRFRTQRHGQPAVDDVSLQVHAGQTVGLVGESGSGKTTLARVIVGLERSDRGTVALQGATVQLVFQDSLAAFNPRLTIAESLAEPLRLAGVDKRETARRVAAALADVALPADVAERLPSRLSGGQLQRVGIARALIPRPDVVVADEPVSALDVPIQIEILELLRSVQQRHGLTLVIVTHDLSVVRRLCSHVAVMRHGRIVERGSVTDVLQHPSHPYTKELIACSPALDDLAVA